ARAWIRRAGAARGRPRGGAVQLPHEAGGRLRAALGRGHQRGRAERDGAAAELSGGRWRITAFTALPRSDLSDSIPTSAPPREGGTGLADRWSGRRAQR